MEITICTAIYFFILFYSILYLNKIITFSILAFGFLILGLISIFKKAKIKQIKKKIEDGNYFNFININKDPWYILELIPNIDRITAKKIVYMRIKQGKYKSIEHCLQTVGVNIAFLEDISKLTRI